MHKCLNWAHVLYYQWNYKTKWTTLRQISEDSTEGRRGSGISMTMAGPWALSSPCLCKPPHDSSVFPTISSHSNHKWVSSMLSSQHLCRATHAQKAHFEPLYRTRLAFFIGWNARTHLGQSFLLNAPSRGFHRQKKGSAVQASLFGVGAPEALVIGVVALLVFGPKGLAEVARTLGRSLRAFQPTIKEIQEVSREFKNTLEQEIGLDEFRSTTINPSNSSPQTLQRETMVEQNGPPGRKAYSTEDYLRVSEDEIKTLVPEEKPKGSEPAQLDNSPPSFAQPRSEVTKQSSYEFTEPSPNRTRSENGKGKDDKNV